MIRHPIRSGLGSCPIDLTGGWGSGEACLSDPNTSDPLAPATSLVIFALILFTVDSASVQRSITRRYWRISWRIFRPSSTPLEISFALALTQRFQALSAFPVMMSSRSTEIAARRARKRSASSARSPRWASRSCKRRSIGGFASLRPPAFERSRSRFALAIRSPMGEGVLARRAATLAAAFRFSRVPGALSG